MLRTSMQTHHAQVDQDQVQTPHPKNFPEHTSSSWALALLLRVQVRETPPYPYPTTYVLLGWEDAEEGQQEAGRCQHGYCFLSRCMCSVKPAMGNSSSHKEVWLHRAERPPQSH